MTQPFAFIVFRVHFSAFAGFSDDAVISKPPVRKSVGPYRILTPVPIVNLGLVKFIPAKKS